MPIKIIKDLSVLVSKNWYSTGGEGKCWQDSNICVEKGLILDLCILTIGISQSACQ